MSKINYDKLPQTIVLTGNNGVGKDTIAKLLNKIIYSQSKKIFGKDVVSYIILPFAKKPRQFVCDMLNITDTEFEKRKRETKDFRNFFSKFCETCKTIWGEDFFVKPVIKTAEKYLTIIPDLRFDVEYKAIRQLKNHIIIGVVNDLTEKTPQEFDILFVNNKNKSLTDLEKDLKDLLIKITN